MFTGVGARVVELYDPHTEADPVAVLAQFLAAFGNAVGPGPYQQVGGTRHGLGEFILVVGDSSQARKGDSKAAAVRDLRGADPEWAGRNVSGLSTGEGLIHHVRDPSYRQSEDGTLELVDEGVTDKRLFIAESEFALPLKQMTRPGNVLSPVLRSAWDGESLQTLTKTTAERATGALISLIAHTTQEDLAALLTDTDAANGLANRFVLISARRSKVLPDPGMPDEGHVECLRSDLRQTLAHARQAKLLERSERAKAIWEDVYPELTAARPGVVGKVLARAHAHVMRLSALFSLSDGARSIDAVHLEAALALWDFSAQSVEMIFAGRTGNSIADRVLALPTGVEISRDELHRAVAKGRPAPDLDDALDLLEARGDILVLQVRTGGRPRTLIRRVQRSAG